MSGLTLTWSHESPDGLTYNIYENDALIITNIAVLNFSIDMTGRPDGEYTYQVTSVRTSDNVESARSLAASVNFIQKPIAPTGLTVTLTD